MTDETSTLSTNKRKCVHVNEDKSTNSSNSIDDAPTSVVASTISFSSSTCATSSEAPVTERNLKDSDCSSDANSEKDLIIDEQIIDNPHDDLKNDENDQGTISKGNE